MSELESILQFTKTEKTYIENFRDFMQKKLEEEKAEISKAYYLGMRDAFTKALEEFNRVESEIIYYME